MSAMSILWTHYHDRVIERTWSPSPGQNLTGDAQYQRNGSKPKANHDLGTNYPVDIVRIWGNCSSNKRYDTTTD